MLLSLLLASTALTPPLSAPLTRPSIALARPHATVAMNAAEDWFRKVAANIEEGTFGERGEPWVAGQALLVLGVLGAPVIPGVSAATTFVGLLSVVAGGALAVAAVLALGPANLTPWPKPVEASALRTEGVYSVCRHPIYAGLIVLCGGLGLLSHSSERLLLTLLLYLLLDAKAGREEEFLLDKHGDAYFAYAADTPRIFGEPASVTRLVETLREGFGGGGSE